VALADPPQAAAFSADLPIQESKKRVVFAVLLWYVLLALLILLGPSGPAGVCKCKGPLSARVRDSGRSVALAAGRPSSRPLGRVQHIALDEVASERRTGHAAEFEQPRWNLQSCLCNSVGNRNPPRSRWVRNHPARLTRMVSLLRGLRPNAFCLDCYFGD